MIMSDFYIITLIILIVGIMFGLLSVVVFVFSDGINAHVINEYSKVGIFIAVVLLVISVMMILSLELYKLVVSL